MRGANVNRLVSVLLYNEDCYLQSEAKPIATRVISEIADREIQLIYQ
jgi:hypothetical protein